MTTLLDDALLPTADAAAIEADLAELEKRLLACREEIARLSAAEDPAKGVYKAAEIHEAKQLHMALRYQKDLRLARLNRLRLEADF